jgi:hypothetical protein
MGKKLLRDLSVDGTIIFKLILKKKGVTVWTEFIRLRIGFNDGLLRIRQ